VSDGALERDIAERVRRAGSSFYWGMRLLPPERRAAMYAIYAFCRAVDDVADGGAPMAEKRRLLDEWRAEVRRAAAGQPLNEVGRALATPIRRFALAIDDFDAVVDGMQMDADGPIRAPDGNQFDLYIDRVACAVGRLSIRAFGAGDVGLPVAAALGRGLQITNILRDLVEDAEIGRLYLPRELLVAHGIDATDPHWALAHARIGEVCQVLAGDAQESFAEARRAMAACPPGTMTGAAIMQAIYERVLARLVARGWGDLERPVRVSTPEKLWIVCRALLGR
jgi:phytoene synthase